MNKYKGDKNMKNSLYVELSPESKYIIECLKVQTRKSLKDLITESIYILGEKYGVRMNNDTNLIEVSVPRDN